MTSNNYIEQVKQDVKNFFLDENHWVYKYGTGSECGPDSPYYKRQIEVLFEKEYQHWETHAAINKLIEEKFLQQHIRRLSYGPTAKFVVRSGVRYYKRHMNKIVKLIDTISRPNMTRTLGRWAEHLSEFMFVRLGFQIIDRNTQKFGDKRWTASDHDLDFIIERDGVYYGVEVKNTLPYMPWEEFKTKLEICKYLNLIPLCILRNAPKRQFAEIKRHNGLILKFKSQVFPIGFEELTAEIWKFTRLPVTVWDRFSEKFEKILMKFHEKNI